MPCTDKEQIPHYNLATPLFILRRFIILNFVQLSNILLVTIFIFIAPFLTLFEAFKFNQELKNEI